MPPKARFTKERIEEAAYQLAKEKGFEAIAAREVARSLGMTVTPIFTYFSGMEELKTAVRDRVRREFEGYLRGSLDYFPAFKEFGARWMRYAAEYPNFYKLLIASGDPLESVDDLLNLFRDTADPITREIADTFAISRKDAWDILRHMVIYANGLCGFLMQESCTMTAETLSDSASQLCLALAARARILDGSLSIGAARDMLSSHGLQPEKKRHLPKKSQKT